jgi:HEAT repeat protein
LKKDIASKDEAARLAAVQGVRDVRDKGVRTLLSRKLDSDSEAVRLAAIQAMPAQKHAEAALALGRALLANQKNETVTKAILTALGDLGMCASLPALESAIALSGGVYGAEALAQIQRIGCPEAAAGLLKLRRPAQEDYQKAISAQPATGARVAPTTPNPKHPLAHLYSPIVTALYPTS